MRPVLVLDIDWQPLRVVDWQEAFCDILCGKLEAIEYSRDHTIKGVTREWPMPSVVRVLRRFRRSRQAIKFSRINIYTRDDFTCQYCTKQFPTEELTFDHVFPRSRGGKTTWENIVTCCINCNFDKADRTPEQAGLKLLSKPKKPSWLPTVMVNMDRRNVPPEWQNYWFTPVDK